MKTRVIPKLDPNIFSKGNHLKNFLREEFNLDLDNRRLFINKYAIGYTLDNDGDPMIMFEVDGCLFWKALFHGTVYEAQLELG